MGYHHHHLANIEQLKSELNRVGIDMFVKRYKKYECLFGESERVEFIRNILKQFNEKHTADITH